MVEGLKNGTSEVKAPVGFGLSPQQFQAQGFYTQSPELRQYYAARQWYAQVLFRVSDSAETAAALRLATLVNDNPELLNLWKQLSEPFDTLLALPEDGSVPGYAEAAKLGQADQVRKKLEATIPFPRINDQRLSESEYANFSQESRGFRLLPPRFMPCSLCFQNTTDPVISNRLVPSGLDFMAASAVMRSDAAVRAVSDQFGRKVRDAILKTDCGLMPDSLHGEALQLLAKLRPLFPPARHPPCGHRLRPIFNCGPNLARGPSSGTPGRCTPKSPYQFPWEWRHRRPKASWRLTRNSLPVWERCRGDQPSRCNATC